MPEICRFYGIIIRMFYDDHNPPHFHAFYGDDEAWININTLAVFSGSLPGRALGLVTELLPHPGIHCEGDRSDRQPSQRGAPTEEVQEKGRGEDFDDHQKWEEAAQEHEEDAKGQ
jgi:hypothetical protein